MSNRPRRNPNYLASGPQVVYLRRLLNEAFANLYRGGPHLDSNHLERVTRVEATSAIEELVAAKRDGWKRVST